MWAKHLVSQIHFGLWLMTIDSDYPRYGLLDHEESASLGLILLRIKNLLPLTQGADPYLILAA